MAAPGAAKPLFLRTVLEELRQFGSFDRLPKQVEYYLEAGTPEELFRRVIRRWQDDFDGGRNLVRRSLVPLWAARRGLAEAEWLEAIAHRTDPVPRSDWRPLFLAMMPHLAHRSGLYAPGHEFLKQAIEAELLPLEDDRRTAHQALADYFAAQPVMSLRKADEWPWQLHAAESWERLEAALTDLDLFLSLCEDRTKWELTGYWHPLRKRGQDLGKSYTGAFHRWLEKHPELAEQARLAHELGTFLVNNGCYLDAESLLQRALEGRERVLGPEHPDTLTSVDNLAVLLESTGDYVQAEPLYRRALEGYERVLGPEHPHTLASVNNLALLLESTGDYVQAEALYRRALEGRERVLGPEHPSTLVSVNNLAALLYSKGDYVQAEPLYRRALEGYERVLGPEHPDTLASVNNLAALLYSKGDYVQAEPLYRRALEGYERVLGPEHPHTLKSVNNLAVLLYSKGDYVQSEPLYRRALEGSERVLGPEHPSTLWSVNCLAALLESKGDYVQAEPLYRRALEGRERILGPEHPSTLRSVNNLAWLLRIRGNFTEAESLYRRILAIAEGIDVTARSRPILTRMATANNELAFHMDVPEKRWKDAENHYRQAIDLYVEAHNPIEAANVRAESPKGLPPLRATGGRGQGQGNDQCPRRRRGPARGKRTQAAPGAGIGSGHCRLIAAPWKLKKVCRDGNATARSRVIWGGLGWSRVGWANAKRCPPRGSVGAYWWARKSPCPPYMMVHDGL